MFTYSAYACVQWTEEASISIVNYKQVGSVERDSIKP